MLFAGSNDLEKLACFKSSFIVLLSSTVESTAFIYVLFSYCSLVALCIILFGPHLGIFADTAAGLVQRHGESTIESGTIYVTVIAKKDTRMAAYTQEIYTQKGPPPGFTLR